MSLLFSFFYFLASGQGFFLTVLTLKRAKFTYLSVLLSFLVMIISIQLLSYGLAYSGLLVRVPHWWGVGSFVFFLIGPGMYFFFRAILQPDFKFKLLDGLHLVPLVLFVVYHRGFYFVSASQKIARLEQIAGKFVPNLSISALFFSLLGGVLLITYYLLIRRLVKRYPESGRRPVLSNTLKLFLAYIVWYGIYKLSLFAGLGYYSIVCFTTKVMMGLCIYALSYIAHANPIQFFSPHKKYQKQLLTDQYSQSLKTKVDQLMQEKMIFRENDLTLEKLAKQVGCSIHELSQLLNSKYQQTFPAYINSLRVSYAQKLLNDQPGLKIWQVEADAGFNNRVTFNTAFKRETGLSPSAYKKQLLQQSS